MLAPAVQTWSLTKRYGTARGIEDISMTVERGEIFGLLGPNGAGKTTLIRTLLNLLHPTSGKASILGLDSVRDSLPIRVRVGNLSGDFTCDPRLTGRELLGFCAAVRGLPDLGTAPALAERFGADLEKPIGDLSRGSRQKIGLLQALLHRPTLLILDEPTSGLDPLMQEAFIEVVGEHRDGGGTVLLSSHVLGEVERVCDRVGIVREGRLVTVQDVGEMRRQAFRHVTIRFDAPVAVDDLRRVEGVTDLVADGATVSFKAHGHLDPIVKAAARHTVVDLDVTEPTLEELFLRFYGPPAERPASSETATDAA
jgi:ABC-2 type transport system ATP-binding protein